MTVLLLLFACADSGPADSLPTLDFPAGCDGGWTNACAPDDGPAAEFSVLNGDCDATSGAIFGTDDTITAGVAWTLDRASDHFWASWWDGDDTNRSTPDNAGVQVVDVSGNIATIDWWVSVGGSMYSGETTASYDDTPVTCG